MLDHVTTFGSKYDVMSFVGIFLAKCDDPTHCILPQNSEHYDELLS